VKYVLAALVASVSFVGTANAIPAYLDPRADPTLILSWENPGGDHAHHCTGFYIGNGMIVTAAHCVYDTDGKKGFWNYPYEVFDRMGNYYGHTIDVLFVDVRHDMAVISDERATDTGIRPAAVSCALPPEGTVIRVAGYPEFLWYQENYGVVKQSSWDEVVSNLWPSHVSHTALQRHGNSGGPVFNAETNEVVGIVVGGVEIDGVHLDEVMVPTATLCTEFLNQVVAENKGHK